MKNVVLVDGNNILFRSYYATAYKGNILRNSKMFPTNALYGFMNMMNKIIKDLNPSYIMVAFDKGKTFRHEKYKEYKDGRCETPEDLKLQFPVAKKFCTAMGIKYFEIDNYEADDIIGTFAKEVDRDDDFIATIVSSDKDLLQLISQDVSVRLLKTSDYIMMNEETFKENYGIEPKRIVDLKALMGDASDNIPGVFGIGEKTALTLLKKWQSLDNIYKNIDEISPKVREKLIKDKDNAYFSYELATIYKDVPIDTDLNKIKYEGPTSEYNKVLEEYEFYSFLKKEKVPKEEEIEYKIIHDIENINIKDPFAIYVECNGSYHDKDIKGIAIYNKTCKYFISLKDIKQANIFTNNIPKYTFDLKKLIVSLNYLNINIDKNIDDLMLEAYLLNLSLKDDIVSLMKKDDIDIKYDHEVYKAKDENIDEIIKRAMQKAKYIYDNKERYETLIKDNDLTYLYNSIELPLVYVLSSMEEEGVLIDKDVLLDMQDELNIKLELLQNEIYNLAGEEFNILSPKQLGQILFEKLNIPYPKRVKNNKYETSVEVLEKIEDYTIVKKILDFRMYAKLYGNYALGLYNCIKEDGKIHTTFNQTLTRTGRLSSTNPNLQNIPVREEYGKSIRRAFIPTKGGVLISADYSQIELRIFASMSGASNMIEAFNNDMDIHTKTAMDIYHVSKDLVTPAMRRNAKAVNFGILYGISSFGLSADLKINVKEAKAFIDNYLNTFPGIKEYMDKVINMAKDKGYVKTLFGRVRYIEELNSSSYLVRVQGERMALNTPVQGTAADILKKAMIEIYQKLNEKHLKAKIIMQIHDELVLDCPKEEVEEVTLIVKTIMEGTYKLNVPLKVDINIGNNLCEAK